MAARARRALLVKGVVGQRLKYLEDSPLEPLSDARIILEIRC